MPNLKLWDKPNKLWEYARYVAGGLLVTTQQADGPGIDAFGRTRVSNPHTIFDTKQLFDNAPLFWDDAEVSGSGTTSVHSVNTVTSLIGVSATTAGKRIRQTFRCFNYEPGKSQEIMMTFSDLLTTSGITKEVGYGDNNNGLFVVSADGNLFFRRRSFTSGAAVDDDVPQASWSLDRMDGSGSSGVTLDPAKSQILFIDFEWLAVGRVRMGFVVDGAIYYAHEFLNANNLAIPYMTSPNLPLRYSIENDGTGAASTFGHICSTVISEGGTNTTGKIGYVSNGSTIVNANTVGTMYALAGLRLKTAGIGASIFIETVTAMGTTANDNFELVLMFNPTIAGAGLTWTDVTNFSVQQGIAEAGNPSPSTVTGGTQIGGAYGAQLSSQTFAVENALTIGSSIDRATMDTVVLCVRPLSSNLDIVGGITFRELS